MRVALLSIVLLCGGCEAFQRASDAAGTPDATGRTPVQHIVSGGSGVITNPINPVAWGELVTGIGALVVAALGVGTTVAIKKAGQAEKVLHNLERIDQMKKVKNGAV